MVAFAKEFPALKFRAFVYAWDGSKASGPMLYAANFRHGTVDMFDQNFNQVGSGTQMSAQDIFSAFKVQIDETNLREGDALEKLKNGEIAGMVATAGKPSPVLRRLKGSEGYHIVPIPLKDSMIGDYFPSVSLRQ